ncbi:hypothetical protein DM2_2337 [Halorubrum sp. DM2]|nr:hypothetical protein DM2_2337 [Halorubrum sp. DM2]
MIADRYLAPGDVPLSVLCGRWGDAFGDRRIGRQPSKRRRGGGADADWNRVNED